MDAGRSAQSAGSAAHLQPAPEPLPWCGSFATGTAVVVLLACSSVHRPARIRLARLTVASAPGLAKSRPSPTFRRTPQVRMRLMPAALHLIVLLHALGGAAANVTYCWGARNSGQLGDGQLGGSNRQPLPTPIVNAPELASVQAGLQHTCGLTAAGQAYCWVRGQVCTARNNALTAEAANSHCVTATSSSSDGMLDNRCEPLLADLVLAGAGTQWRAGCGSCKRHLPGCAHPRCWQPDLYQPVTGRRFQLRHRRQ